MLNNPKSWVDEALTYNGLTHGGTFESAFRVSNHLCRFYRDSFVAAMEKQGMAITQPMSTVQYAICSDDERAQHHWEKGKSGREVHATTPWPIILSDTEKGVDIGCGTHQSQSPHW